MNTLEKIVMKIEEAPNWQGLYSTFRGDESILSFLQEKYGNDTSKFLIDQNTNSPLTREYFTRAIRQTYFFCKNQTQNTASQYQHQTRIFTHDNYFIDNVRIEVYGIAHDEQGLKEVARKIENNALIILEPELPNYFAKDKPVISIPRKQETRYLTFWEKVKVEFDIGALLAYYQNLLHIQSKKQEKKDEKYLKHIYHALCSPIPKHLEQNLVAYVVGEPVRAQTLYSLQRNHISLARSLAQSEFTIEIAHQKGIERLNLVVGLAHAIDLRYIHTLPNIREELLKQYTTKVRR